jgi:O-antigen/teichoic acid export membrane protein
MEAIVSWLSYNRRRVFSWFKDDGFRRLFLNAGKLLSANVFAAILGFITTVLTARALGPDKYGILALVLVYELAIGKLVTFNAWQAIIKFGSEALHADDRQALRQLIKFGFGLDIASAVVGTILAMVLAGPLIGLLGWDPSVRTLLVLYSTLILFNLSGTPTGILRLFDRFDLLSYAAVLSATLGLTGVLWCVLTRQSLYAFVLMYLITGIIGQLYYFLASFWVLRKARISDFVLQSLRGLPKRCPGILDYVWTTYLNSTVVMTLREGSTIVIAGLTTPAALGFYKMAQQISKVLPMLSDPLYQAIYPELSRLWAVNSKAAFFSLIKRTAFLMGVLGVSGWLAFILTGQWIIVKTVGSAYADVYLVAVVYMLAFAIGLCGVCLQPAMLAMGLPRKSLVAISIGTVFYFILLIPLVEAIGIVGASVAYVGYYIVWLSVMLFCLWPCPVTSRAIAE